MFSKYNIYISKKSDTIAITNIEKYSNYRQVKIANASSLALKQLNIQTEQLLFYGLKQFNNKLITVPEILTTKQGKPYFKDSKYTFNITHSHNYIVVAIGTDDLGVDIEKIDPKRLKLAPKIFNDNELGELNNNIEHLIETWTIKESYVKLYDLSILINLRNINIKDNEINSKYGRAFFKTFKIDNYYLALTSKRQVKVTIHNVDL